MTSAVPRDVATPTITLSLMSRITGTITGSYDDYAITCTIKKGESSLPDEKGGGSKTLTAINNNGDIDIEFVSE